MKRLRCIIVNVFMYNSEQQCVYVEIFLNNHFFCCSLFLFSLCGVRELCGLLFDALKLSLRQIVYMYGRVCARACVLCLLCDLKPDL